MRARFRDPVSGWTHFAAAVAAVFGLAVLLMFGYGSLPLEIALFVYGFSLIFMFSASAAYHLVNATQKVTQILRKMDHAAIYLLIAGTYTPICYYFFTGFWHWGLLAIIWVMALAGVIVKLFVINAPRWITAGIYLLMGWLSILAVREIILTMPASAVVWLVLGGLFFTIGAVVYIKKTPDFFPDVFGFHEVWHIFVILGCLSHFILIAAYVAPNALPV
jgi:hemolysin III